MDTLKPQNERLNHMIFKDIYVICKKMTKMGYDHKMTITLYNDT